MDARRIIAAILAYGRAERALAEGTGSYGDVDAALDTLLVTLWPVPSREIARKCGWCDAYASPEDEALARTGAPVSHGLCSVCAATMNQQADAMDRQVAR